MGLSSEICGAVRGGRLSATARAGRLYTAANYSAPFSPCLNFGSVADAGWDRLPSLSLIDLATRALER